MEHNVLHLIDNLEQGGAQIIFKNIVEFGPSSVFGLSFKQGDINVHSKNFMPGKHNYLSSLRKIYTIVKNNPISLLHCHLFKSQLTGFLLKIILGKKIKLVFHIHGIIMPNESCGSIFWRLYRLFLVLSASLPDAHIVITHNEKNRLLKLTKRAKRIELIHNYFNPDRVSRKNACCFSLENGCKIGFLGRIVDIKGWRIVIQLAKLFREFSQIKFIICGDGPEAKSLVASIREHKLAHTVSYLGFIDDVANQFYSDIDLLLIPSYYESFGLVLLEGWASGLPIVAANVKSLNELADDRKNIVFFKAGDVQDLKHKITQLSQDTNLQHKIIEGGLTSSRNYTFNAFLQKVQELHTRL